MTRCWWDHTSHTARHARHHVTLLRGDRSGAGIANHMSYLISTAVLAQLGPGLAADFGLAPEKLPRAPENMVDKLLAVCYLMHHRDVVQHLEDLDVPLDMWLRAAKNHYFAHGLDEKRSMGCSSFRSNPEDLEGAAAQHGLSPSEDELNEAIRHRCPLIAPEGLIDGSHRSADWQLWDLEGSQYRLQSPETLETSYAERRKECLDWSPPTPLDQYMKGQLEARSFTTVSKRMFDELCFRPFGPFHGCDWAASVSYCRHRLVEVVGGVSRDVEYVFTRVKTLNMAPTEYRSVTVLQPRPTVGGPAYLVESFDGIFDDWLREILYPPVHPHHSNTLISGKRPTILREFLPFTVADHDAFEAARLGTSSKHNVPKSILFKLGLDRRSPWFRSSLSFASANSPGYNVDLLGCHGRREPQLLAALNAAVAIAATATEARGGASPAAVAAKQLPVHGMGACYYLKQPDGFGWLLDDVTDFFSNTVAKDVRKAGPPINLTWEFGRKYVSGGPAKLQGVVRVNRISTPAHCPLVLFPTSLLRR